jgi:starch phosphorylase
MILNLKEKFEIETAVLFCKCRYSKYIKKLFKDKKTVNDLYKYVAIHINDTHPSLAVAELMRILIDEKQLEWDEAWNITTKTISYTNHTIMAEALEKWPIGILRTYFLEFL